MLRGESYYHVAQPLGNRFEVDRVRGYYNDMTAKADWSGVVDAEGVPVDTLSNGKQIHFPITIAQVALGAYDLYLASGEKRRLDLFLRMARWLLANQDESGGWVNPWRDLRPTCTHDYSGMAQGEAISVLVRAELEARSHEDSVASEYRRSARRAFELLSRPLEEGGCAVWNGDSVTVEEYPESPPSTVLNGWVYALFGVYDFMLVTNDGQVSNFWNHSVNTLVRALPSYALSYWTSYDLAGTVASPFYHTLHIAQMEAMHRLTGDETFALFARRWREQRERRLNRTRAMVRKTFQKLRRPPEVVLVQPT